MRGALLVIVRDARHAVVIAEFADDDAGLLRHLGNARIADQPRVAGNLDQHVLQAFREARSSCLLALAGDDGLSLIEIVNFGGGRGAEDKHDKGRQRRG